MSNVVLNILSEFKGKKAFKQADTAVSKLNKGVKALGVSIGVVGAALYGKSAVKAFAADEAAAKRLATAVDNLGLSFSKVQVADFIAKTERSSGILDDQLRPAMQGLLTTTGSLTKSQELLNNAIQISRASGIDLATVAQDLSNGYVGITKGLKKYNTGLTQTELKTKSFSEVLGIMLAKSANAANAYMTTTAYKMDVLNVAAANAKESIGGGLVDALAKAAGGTTAEDAAKAFDTIAKSINGISSAIGTAIGFFTKLYKKLDDFTYNFDPIIGDSRAMQDRLAKIGSARQSSPAGAMARQKQEKAAQLLADKRARELKKMQEAQVKAQKALTAEQKKQAALKKAGSIFDLEQANLIAALKKNLSEEDRKRAELQLALLTGNVTEAQKLAGELAKSQGLGKDLADFLAGLPDAKNPFEAWKAYLDKIELQVARIANVSPVASYSGGGAADAAGYSGSYDFYQNPATGGSVMDNYQPNSGTSSPASVVVQIDGKTIASALLDQSLSGNQAYVNRRTGGFE